jgi:alpha-methylacyl-CoA racemase
MQRGQNVLDGGAPYYSIYECAKIPSDSLDSLLPQYMTVACLEPQFFHEFISIFKNHIPISVGSPLYGVSEQDLQIDRKNWPQLREYLKNGFSTRTRDEWSEIFHGMSYAYH